MALEVKFFTLKEKICAWEIHDTATNQYYNGAARPFKSSASLDKILPSEYFPLPYTKKQLKSFEYIGRLAPFFEDLFKKADSIHPAAFYDHVLKHTFGPKSPVFQLYAEKAVAADAPASKPILYIDFEAMNMRICGWYAELVDREKNETTVFEGIAKPFSDNRYITRLWNNTYQDLLPYSLEDLYKAKHIRSFEKYFINMFSRAKKIYTYGDTDSLFLKSSFGNDMFNFFRVRNVDCSMKIGNRVLSLEKSCRLMGVDLEGTAHNPKYDVQRMRAYLDKSEEL